MSINPFDLLGLTTDSKIEDLKKSFKQLSFIAHPDKGGNNEDMIILYNAYKYVREQIEYAGHGKTYESLEEEFEEFCKKQESKKVPTILEIYHGDFLKEFNKEFENTSEKCGMTYDKGYEKELKDTNPIKKTVAIYEKPVADKYTGFSQHYDLNNSNITNFSDYNYGTDYVEAYGEYDKDTYEKYKEDLSKNQEEDINKIFEEEIKKRELKK